jgi:hypothetical protein
MSRCVTPVAVVAASTRSLNRWIGARSLHHRQVIVIDVPPTTDPTVDLVCDGVLVGLGKDSELTHGKTAPIPITEAWLSLGEHTDAVVVDAQLLPARVLDQTIELLSRYGIRTWLVLSPSDDSDALGRHFELVTGRAGDLVDEAALRAAFPDIPRPTPPTPQVTRRRLPRVSGYTFRSACKNLLDRDHFAEVDVQFVAAVRELRAEVGDISGAAKRRTLMRKLQRRLAATVDTDELMLWVAAAQVAVVPHQFMITVNLPTLIGAAEGLPRHGKAEPERWWELLNSYRDPSIGTIAALYHAGIDPDRIRFIERSDLQPRDDQDQSVVTVDGNQYLITGAAARFVEAQRVYRELATVGHSEFLFSTHRAGQVGLKHVNHQLLVPSADLDVRIAAGPVRAKHPDADRWLLRYGIRVEKLTYTPTAQAVAS